MSYVNNPAGSFGDKLYKLTKKKRKFKDTAALKYTEQVDKQKKRKVQRHRCVKIYWTDRLETELRIPRGSRTKWTTWCDVFMFDSIFIFINLVFQPFSIAKLAMFLIGTLILVW